MKESTLLSAVRVTVRGIVIAFAAAFAVHALAQTTVAPGTDPRKAGMVSAVDFNGMIAGIDSATRDITVKGDKGGWLTVTAGPEVKNFDQLKVGDLVHVNYTAALVLELKKGNELAVTRSEQSGVMGAAPGQPPGAVAGRRITAVADVIAVDPATRTATLRGPQNTVNVTFADPDQFRRIKVGDQVYATYTQALAVAVEKK